VHTGPIVHDPSNHHVTLSDTTRISQEIAKVQRIATIAEDPTAMNCECTLLDLLNSRSSSSIGAVDVATDRTVLLELLPLTLLRMLFAQQAATKTRDERVESQCID
jgi:hypothetical protein